MPGFRTGSTRLAVCRYGRLLVAGSDDSMLKLWDLSSGSPRTFQGRGDKVESADLSADGRTILSVGGTKQLNLWDARGGGEPRSFSTADTYIGGPARLSPDGRIALASVGVQNGAKLWDIATGKELPSLKALNHFISSASFSPDSRTVVTASYDGTVRIWDAATGAELRSFNGHGGRVAMAAFFPDGRTVLSGDEKGGMKIWEAATGRESRSFTDEAGRLCAVAFC